MSRLKRLCGVAVAAVAVAGVIGLTSSANATSVQYDFTNHGGNTGYSGSEFVMTVNDLGNNLASFVFQNNGPAGSAITGIYMYAMDDSIVNGSTATIDNSNISGSFTENGGNPGNLPGGNPLGLTGNNQAFYSHSQGINGIGSGEFLTITMEYIGTFPDVINALESGMGVSQSNPFSTGDLVVGLHVQGLPDSDTFLHNEDIQMQVIPLPAPVWMGLAGLVGIAAMRRRRS